MPWLVLVLSGVFEAVWATALGMSDGFTRPVPVVVFLVASAISLYGLGWAMQRIPMGTAYAVWAGVGGSLTVIWAMATGAEPFSWVRALLLTGIVCSIAGLKFSSPAGQDTDTWPSRALDQTPVP